MIDAVRDHGLYNESMIAFTADHGEIMHRSNALFKWSHGYQLAPEVLSVPLIIHAPALRGKPRRYSALTRSIDVFPTMLGLAGFDVPQDAGIAGVDLSPAFAGEMPPKLQANVHTSVLERTTRFLKADQNWQLLHSFFPDQNPEWLWVGRIDAEHTAKLRNLGDQQWGVEIFDRRQDPTEEKNLFDPQNHSHQQIAEELKKYKAHLLERFAYHKRHTQDSGEAVSDSETIELLKKLGCID